MEIKIISIGKKAPKWVEAAFSEYYTRLQHELNITYTQISTPTRTKTTNISKIKNLESEKILKEIKQPGVIISLDENGKTLNTHNIAKKLNEWHFNSDAIYFIIGGPDGLAQNILNQSNEIWSLSKLTFPHHMALIILIEQLYRAHSINIKHPYHRD